MHVIGIIVKKYLMLTATGLLFLSCLTLTSCDSNRRFLYDRDMWMKDSPWSDTDADPRAYHDSIPI
jgi:hypothetical protein